MSKPERLSEAELLALFDEMTTHVRDNGYCEYEWHTKHGCGFYAAQHGETCPVTKVRRALAELAAKDAEIARLQGESELAQGMLATALENEKRLIEALGPFAHAGKHCDLPTESSSPTFVCDEDYRRAAKALGG